MLSFLKTIGVAKSLIATEFAKSGTEWCHDITAPGLRQNKLWHAVKSSSGEKLTHLSLGPGNDHNS